LKKSWSILKDKRGIQLDTEFTVQDLKDLVYDFKDAVKKRTGHDFPANPWDQLWGAVIAVFNSWNGGRAVYYRNMNGYPANWETAVNVQAGYSMDVAPCSGHIDPSIDFDLKR